LARASYAARLFALIRQGAAQIVRPPSHSRRAEAARANARQTLWLLAGGAVFILVLLVGLDAREITWMPKRGDPSLWLLRIVTDFGKSTYVNVALCVALVVVTLLAARLVGTAHAVLARLASRIEYVLVSVALAVAIGEVLKGFIGRGRPFVGGAPNAFNFFNLDWSEAHASFPSGHATTAGALTFAVIALWPRLWLPMVLYAVTILVTRLVLLAHHTSDVIAGALLGLTVAMAVRYWFAARRAVFVIHSDGRITAKHGVRPRAIGRAFRQALTS
jgi:undecaprenyl-diphosphatase